MKQIEKQVVIAGRRLLVRRFAQYVTWALSIGLVIAIIGLAIPKVWAVPGLEQSVDAERWNIGWLVGASVVAVVVAVLLCWLRRDSSLRTAVEIDRRFSLKERLSSAMSLDESDRQSRAGAALLKDAQRAAERIDVRDQFSYGWSWRNLAPVLPATIACLLILFVDNAKSQPAEESAENTIEYRERIKAANDALREKIEEELERAEEEGLEEAESALREVETALDDPVLTDPKEREQAMIRLNEIKDRLEERVEELGSPEAMRRQLAAMDPEKDGPADAANDALNEGDLDKAAEELEKLADELKNGELSEEEKAKLTEQLKEMSEKLDDAVDRHEQNKQRLREQIQEAVADGDLQKAGELQEKLDQAENQDSQMSQAQGIANSLGQASQSLNSNQGGADGGASSSQAGEALEEAASGLSEVQSSINEVDSLESVLDKIAEAKQCMNPGQGQNGNGQASPSNSGSPSADGSQQSGEGNGQSQNPSQGNGQGSQNGEPGYGNGEGQGRGDRAVQENETQSQDSRVDSTANEGRAVVTGTTGGENLSSSSRAEIERRVQEPINVRNDPLQDQTLPRRQQEHARDYFREYSRQNN